jgi:hypothetical protein
MYMTTAKMYIPTAVGEDMIESIKMSAALEFGGYTIYDATGGWVNEDAELIEEPVKVLEVVTDDDNMVLLTDRMEAFAKRIIDKTDEDMVLYTVDGSRCTVLR